MYNSRVEPSSLSSSNISSSNFEPIRAKHSLIYTLSLVQRATYFKPSIFLNAWLRGQAKPNWTWNDHKLAWLIYILRSNTWAENKGLEIEMELF